MSEVRTAHIAEEAKFTCPQLRPLPPIADVKRAAARSQKIMDMNNLVTPC
jgi:hypothetical protein